MTAVVPAGMLTAVALRDLHRLAVAPRLDLFVRHRRLRESWTLKIDDRRRGVNEGAADAVSAADATPPAPPARRAAASRCRRAATSSRRMRQVALPAACSATAAAAARARRLGLGQRRGAAGDDRAPRPPARGRPAAGRRRRPPRRPDASARTLSTSIGETLMPLTRSRSLLRPSKWKTPPASMRPRSPVRKNPSSSRPRAGRLLVVAAEQAGAAHAHLAVDDAQLDARQRRAERDARASAGASRQSSAVT